nr:RNA-directed DNA polymerase, eukaryota [Tanacetum cinerariifolium]
MGLAVSIAKVEEVTRHIGCGILNTPFSFLRSKVGGCMSRIKSWDEVIDKMVNRLSKWKMKTLSSGGRLTLFKAVFGSMPIYHMSILRDSLWVRIIHAIHGVDGRIGRDGNVGYTSIWCNIIKEMDRMARSAIESEQWDHILDSLEGVMLNPSEDRWSWDLNGSGEFSVASARRDTVQLETAVNTISHEYLLEFTSEYGIPETLHHVLPGPEDRIVDFLEGKLQKAGRNTPQCYTKPLDSLKNWNNRFFWVDERVFSTVVDWRTNASKDGMPAASTYSLKAVRVLDTHRTPIQKQLKMLLCLVGISRRYYLGDEVYPIFLHDDDRDMDLFNLIRAPNPTKVKVGSRSRAPHEVPRLTLTAPRVIEIDELAATDSSGIPSKIERSSLDFANEAKASDQGAVASEIPSSEDVPATVASWVGQAKEAATMDPPTALKSRKRCHDGADVNPPPKSLRRDYADPQPSESSRGGKSFAAIQLGMASSIVPEDAPVGVSDPDPMSFADASSRHPADGIAAAGDPGSENVSSPAEVGSPGSVNGNGHHHFARVSSHFATLYAIESPRRGVRVTTPDCGSSIV